MTNVLFCFFLSLILFSWHIHSKEDPKLVFVQILFRHGDRAPAKLYPNDPNPESTWVEGLGELTMLGHQQQYALGKLLRRMYDSFITSNPNEVSVISSDVDRCKKSAKANLASFFEPSPKSQLEGKLNWQPISVSSIPKDNDKFFNTEIYCPKAAAELLRILDSLQCKAVFAKYEEMFKNLTINSGSPITNWIAATYFQDILFVEKKYNLTIPSWAYPYLKELGTVSGLAFYWGFNSPLLHRLRAGPLLKMIVEMMKSKIAGDIPLQKIQIYSAHDVNIAVMLNALNLYNMKRPPYCASLLFELYKMADGENAVRLLYLNSTHPEKEIQVPHILILEGCSEYCPLSYFITFTRNSIPDDWEKECQLDKSSVKELKEKNINIHLWFSVISLIIVVLSIYSVWRVYMHGIK